MNFHNKNKGFTLIELLVVVSIIGLLSSIVLASMTAAKKKAQVSTRVSLASEYVKAFSLYYNDNNSYPVPDSTRQGWFTFDSTLLYKYGREVCLGPASASCTTYNTSGTLGDNQVANALNPYIPGPPEDTSGQYQGIIYRYFTKTDNGTDVFPDKATFLIGFEYSIVTSCPQISGTDNFRQAVTAPSIVPKRLNCYYTLQI